MLCLMPTLRKKGRSKSSIELVRIRYSFQNIDADTPRRPHTVAMPAITQFVLEGTKLKTPEIQPLNTRSKAQDDIDLDVNPEAVPFLPQSFMSSTVLKKIAVPKRHLDTFGGMEYNVTGRRGVILHTDRYQWASFRPLDGMSQRDRLLAELLYMEKLRGVKRRREVLPHRAQLDLVMGGKKIEMEERFDIAREIQKLKSLVLPQNAKDLFHGRGFRLPDGHGSVNPRGQPYDITEEISASAPALMQQPIRMNPDFLSQRLPSQASIFNSPSKLKKRGQLPSLNRGRGQGFTKFIGHFISRQHITEIYIKHFVQYTRLMRFCVFRLLERFLLPHD